MAKITVPTAEIIDSTARTAVRNAGRTARTILTGGRAAPLARDAGTYERTVTSEARRASVRTLDAAVGRPTGRGVTDAVRLSFYLSVDDDGEE
jgi:hypothetical protein